MAFFCGVHWDCSVFYSLSSLSIFYHLFFPSFPPTFTFPFLPHAAASNRLSFGFNIPAMFRSSPCLPMLQGQELQVSMEDIDWDGLFEDTTKDEDNKYSSYANTGDGKCRGHRVCLCVYWCEPPFYFVASRKMLVDASLFVCLWSCRHRQDYDFDTLLSKHIWQLILLDTSCCLSQVPWKRTTARRW